MLPDNSDFEQDFEHALASYADPDASGLAARVLAMIDSRQRKRRWLLCWSMAVPAFASIVVAAFLLWPVRRSPEIAMALKSSSSVLPEQLPEQLNGQTVPAKGPAFRPTSERQAKKHFSSAVEAPRKLPKLDQFPSPTPLTEQEKLLVAFSTKTPPEQQAAIAKAKLEAEKPLQISRLSIPPISPEPQKP